MKRCYILILNYKKWQEALECTRSVLASSYPDLRIIIIDNNSGNRSLEQLKQELQDRAVQNVPGEADILLVDHRAFATRAPARLPLITLVQNDVNAGFAAGNNVALRAVMQEDAYVWLLNPDMTVKEDTLAQMVGCARATTNAIVGAVHRSFYDVEKVILYGGARVNYWSGNNALIKKPEDIGRAGFISGGSLLTDAATYRAVGLLPEDYFLYWEETDWCYRARKSGFSIVVCPEATCYDKRSTTIGSGFLADYFYTRNGLLFLKKFKSGFLPSALSMVVVRIAKKLVMGQGRRAKGVLLGAIDFLTGRRYEKKGI